MQKGLAINTALFFLLIFSFPSSGRNTGIDSLYDELSRARHDTTRINLLLAIGDQLEYDNPDSALYFYIKAKELALKHSGANNSLTPNIADKNEFTYLYARSLSYIGLLWKDKGKPAEAISNLKASLKIFEQLSAGSGIVEQKKYKFATANNLQYLGLVKQDMGEYKDAISFLQQELNLRKELNDEKGLSSCYLNIGGDYDDLGDYDKALELFNKSLETDSRINDKFQTSTAYNNIALVYRKMGNYVKALENLQKSDGILDLLVGSEKDAGKRNKYKYYKAMTLSNIGIIHYNLKNYPAAMKYYNEALPVYNEINNKRGVAYTYNNMGNINKDLGNYDEALEYFNKSLWVKEEIGDKKGMSSSYGNIGQVYEYYKNYPEAISYYNKSLKIKYEIGDKQGISFTCQDIATLFLKLRDYPKAVENAEKGLAIAREIKSLDDEKTAYKNLSEAWEYLQNSPKALAYYKLYSKANDSLLSVEKNRQIAEMETKYQSEKKDREILMQKTTIANKEAEIEHKNKTRNAILVCFAIIIMIAFIIYRYRVSIARKNEEIKLRNAIIEGEQYERSRISIELHDAIGSDLSAVKILLNNSKKDSTFDNEIFNKGLLKLDETQHNVRRISRNILPRTLVETGLAGALADLFDDYRAAGCLKINFQTFGMQKRLNPTVEFNIYRIIQEIMQNIIKHSSATEVLVELNENRNELRLVIEDNGKGFDYERAEKANGSGLKNIRSRVGLLNGKTSVESGLNQGTTFEIQIPLLT